MSWTGGYISVGEGGTGGFNLLPGKTLTIEGTDYKYLSNGKLTIEGQADWTGGRLYLNNGSYLKVNRDGLFDIKTDESIWYSSGAVPTFTNEGTLLKSAGTGETDLSYFYNLKFTNSGLVDARTGTLNFSGINSFNDGSRFIGSGSNRVTNDAVLNGTITSENLNLADGTFTGVATFSGDTTWSGGTMSGSGTAFTVPSGSTLRLANSGGYLYLTDSASLLDYGTAVWTGSRLYLNDGGKITVKSGGLFDIKTDESIWYSSGAVPTFTNEGTLRKSAGTGVSKIGYYYSFPVNNSTGTIDIQSGIIDVPGSFSTSGVIDVASGATFKRSGGFTNAGTIKGAGTINVGAGYTLTNTGTIRPGTNEATGTLSLTGGLLLDPAGSLDVRLGGVEAGQYDKLTVSEGIAMNGTLNADLYNDYNPANDDAIPFLTMGGTATGTFSTTNVFTGFAVGYNLYAGEAARLVYSGSNSNFFNNSQGNLDWGVAKNWSRGLLPISTDSALIDSGFAVTHAYGTDTVGRLTISSNNSLDVSGGSLNVLGTTSLSGALTVSNTGSARLKDGVNGIGTVNVKGGDLTLDVSTSLYNLNLSGGEVRGSGDLTVTNDYVNTGGSLGTGFQNLSLNRMGDFSVEALTAANSITLAATGNITQTGALTTNTLHLTNTSGTTNLSTQNNAISYLGSIDATGRDFALKNTLALNQTGVLKAGTLSLVNTSGATDLSTQDNVISQLGTIDATGQTFSLKNTGTVLYQTGAITAGVLNLNTAGGIDLTGNNNVPTLHLTNSTTGNINYISSIGSGNTLTVDGSNSTAGGTFAVTENTGNLKVGVLGGANGVQSDGKMTLRAVHGDIILDKTATMTSGGDTIILASGRNFVNNVGSSALNPGAGRWLVYSSDPANDTRGGLSYDFKQYNTAFGGDISGSGNGFIYTVAPKVTVGLAGEVNKVYDGTNSATFSAGNYTKSGAIDGDTVNINNPAAGLYDTRHVGTGKNVSVTGLEIASASNGNALVYGYQLADTGANGDIGTIAKAPLTITAQTNTKTYDGNTSAAATPTYAGLQPGDTVTDLIEAYTDKNAGTNKTLAVTGFSVNDGNSGNNYNVTTASDATGVINKAPLTITAQTNTKAYDGNTSAAATPTYAGLQPGDTLTGMSETYDTADPGTGKTLTVAPGYTLDDGNSGENYTVTTVADTTGVINKDVNAQQQDQAIVQAENTTVASITNTDTATVEQKNVQTTVPAAKEETTASSDTQSAEGKDKDKDKDKEKDKEKDSDKKGAKDERKDEPTKVKLPYCN